MPSAKATHGISIPALRVNQWLAPWDEVSYDDKKFQSKPNDHFYLFTVQARTLKALTGVYRRSARRGAPRAKDPNVQRGHEEERSRTIREFVQFGFPWCDMGPAKRSQDKGLKLRKPGWLPTAIIVNVLMPGDRRNGQVIPESDLVRIQDAGGSPTLVLPKAFSADGWEPERVYPLEVIDGQHRLWAFDDFSPAGDFELPVVAFHGLDRSWQAYLFWSINITPKRINRSLAFDLYPLLRKEEWLDRFAGHAIYRETRCQELVEALWAHPDSPWCQRVNMLGESAAKRESNVPMATQAAWIRTLMATLVKQWEGNATKVGGLFGASRSEHDLFLRWNRPMQAAFLIIIGQMTRDEIAKSHATWAQDLRKHREETLFDEPEDLAFYGRYSLLTTDQGIRGLLSMFNDLCYVHASELSLDTPEWHERWQQEYTTKAKSVLATDEDAVTAAIRTIPRTLKQFLSKIAKRLAEFDWRTSATPDLPDKERQVRLGLRGGSGYRELRRQLLEHLSKAADPIGNCARTVKDILGY